MAAIAAMKFRFHEEEDASDTVSRIAGLMHTRQPQHLLSGDYLHESWDPALVRGGGARVLRWRACCASWGCCAAVLLGLLGCWAAVLLGLLGCCDCWAAGLLGCSAARLARLARLGLTACGVGNQGQLCCRGPAWAAGLQVVCPRSSAWAEARLAPCRG
jgi:hypothetical protein